MSNRLAHALHMRLQVSLVVHCSLSKHRAWMNIGDYGGLAMHIHIHTKNIRNTCGCLGLSIRRIVNCRQRLGHEPTHEHRASRLVRSVTKPPQCEAKCRYCFSCQLHTRLIPKDRDCSDHQASQQAEDNLKEWLCSWSVTT